MAPELCLHIQKVSAIEIPRSTRKVMRWQAIYDTRIQTTSKQTRAASSHVNYEASNEKKEGTGNEWVNKCNRMVFHANKVWK